ncbi:hypothetical protein Tco_1450120 [Tanacetum coccineum]
MFHKKNIDYVYLLWEDLLFQIEKKDAKKTNKMSYPRFTKIIIDYFMSKDLSISRRNKIFWHIARDDTMFTSMRCISRHEDTQVYGTILPKELTIQAMLESNAYKTYYAFASREKAQKPKLKSKANVAKLDKKKQHAKKTKAKGLTILSEQKKSSGTDEGTGSIPGVPDVPIYESKSEKESWGDSEDEDEDEENNSDDISDEGDKDNDGNNGNNDAKDDDKQEGDDMNNDDEETDSDRSELDRIKIPILDQSTTKYYKEEEENIDDEDMMYDDEDDEVTKELYEDVNVNLGNEDTKMTNADQGASEQQNVSQESGFEKVEEDAHVTLTLVLDTQKADEPVQGSFVSSDFTSKLLNLENPSPANNEIASLMETLARHATTVLEITSGFITTIHPPPSFFNPLLQHATPALTPTTSEATTSFPSLPDFASVFKFNERVTNLEKDLSEIKQVDQYAQDLSSIPAIVDRYMDNKLGKAINKAIQAHNSDCREEAQAEKKEYIELVDSIVRTIIKEEVNAQLPQILPQAISDVATPIIEKNVTESVEAAVLTRSSSQPTSTFEAAASLSEFELTKILIDKMVKNKSYDKADYKNKLYDALVESYNTGKDLFDSYGEVFSLKRSRDERDKDRDPSAGSDRGMKRRKSNKDAESSRDSRSKEKNSSSTSKDASQSQHKSSGKSAHAEEPSHIVEDSSMQQDQESATGDNDEQPTNKETWISQAARAEEPPTLFDELNDTSFYFSAFVINRLKISNLTQEILVGPAFNLLKGTCKSIMELEYHLKECSKAIIERLDWHNPENKPYPFDLRKPLPLIQDHQGGQIIPKDYFINKDLEYLKGGDLSRRYLTSMTKTKAVTYELKWIEYLVPELWNPVEDLQLGVKSYQKKLNLTKPDTYKSNLRNKTAYTSYSDPHGIIYVDQYKRKTLMRADELHKFNDGTLNDVQSALYDIVAGIRMEYLPMRKWSNLDKKRAWVMVQDIDKQLYQRGLMQNLEKFVGGRVYGNDHSLLERTK